MKYFTNIIIFSELILFIIYNLLYKWISLSLEKAMFILIITLFIIFCIRFFILFLNKILWKDKKEIKRLILPFIIFITTIILLILLMKLSLSIWYYLYFPFLIWVILILFSLYNSKSKHWIKKYLANIIIFIVIIIPAFEFLSVWKYENPTYTKERYYLSNEWCPLLVCGASDFFSDGGSGAAHYHFSEMVNYYNIILFFLEYLYFGLF